MLICITAFAVAASCRANRAQFDMYKEISRDFIKMATAQILVLIVYVWVSSMVSAPVYEHVALILNMCIIDVYLRS